MFVRDGRQEHARQRVLPITEVCSIHEVAVCLLFNPRLCTCQTIYSDTIVLQLMLASLQDAWGGKQEQQTAARMTKMAQGESA